MSRLHPALLFLLGLKLILGSSPSDAVTDSGYHELIPLVTKIDHDLIDLLVDIMLALFTSREARSAWALRDQLCLARYDGQVNLQPQYWHILGTYLGQMILMAKVGIYDCACGEASTGT